MVCINIEKKLRDLLFERGLILSYEDKNPSSPEDMYEIIFYLDNGVEKTEYKKMFIRNQNNPKHKAFSILLDEIIDSYFNSVNLGKREDVALSD